MLINYLSKKILIQITTLTLVLALALITPPRGLTQSPDDQNIQSTQISGEVLKIDKEKDQAKIFIQSNGETKEVTIPQNVSVTKNSVSANLDQLSPNDQVTITQGENGEVLGVSAISGRLIDVSNIALPVGVLLVLGMIILIYLLQRSGRGHVKTTATRVR